MKKITNCILVSVVAIILLFSGCNRNENRVIPLTDVVDLSPSTITSITVSEYDGKPTKIENKKQLEDICSFLSKITIKGSYTEKKPTKAEGGGGDGNFSIKYSNKTGCYIRIYTDSKELEINGDTKRGEIEGKSNVYPLTDASQVKNVKDYINMQPVK